MPKCYYPCPSVTILAQVLLPLAAFATKHLSCGLPSHHSSILWIPEPGQQHVVGVANDPLVLVGVMQASALTDYLRPQTGLSA